MHLHITHVLKTELWEKNQDISQWNILETALMPHLQPHYLKSLPSLIESQSIKDELIHVTNFCVNLGAFGAPWIHIQFADGKEECFFGSDRFEIIAHLLNKPWYGPNPSQSKL